MTIAPERLDELDFPTPEIEDEPIPYNDGALVFRTEEPTYQPVPLRILSIEDGVIHAEPIEQPRATMADFREAMDEMERSYVGERLGTFADIVTAPQPLPTGEEIYRDIIEARQRILEQPNYVMAQRVIDEQRRVRQIEEDRERMAQARMQYIEPWGSGYSDHLGRRSYCYCSPGRGMFFDRHNEAEYAAHLMEWPEPVTFTRWDPTPVVQPVADHLPLKITDL